MVSNNILEKEWPTLTKNPAPSSTPAATKFQPRTEGTPVKASTSAWGPQEQLSPQEYRKLFDSTFRELTDGNTIKPLPGALEELQHRVLSLITSDTRSKSLTGFAKEIMAKLLQDLNIPAHYMCRRSYAMWELLLSTKEDAEKLAKAKLNRKNISLKPEYLGKRRTTVSVLGVPCYLKSKQLGAVFSQYGDVESVSAAGQRPAQHYDRRL